MKLSPLNKEEVPVTMMTRSEAQGRGFLTGNSRRLKMKPSGITPTPTHGTGRPAALHLVGTRGPSMPVHRPTPKRELREVGPIEQGWLNGKPYFKTPVPTGLRKPIGLTMLDGMARYLSRQAEIKAIAENWDKELPTIQQELAANGIQCISTSSSRKTNSDDEVPADNISWQGIGHVPYDPDPETIGPLTARIEWERYMLSCGMPEHIYLNIYPGDTPACPACGHAGHPVLTDGIEHCAECGYDGKFTIPAKGATIKSDGKTPQSELGRYAGTFRAMLDGRSLDDLQNDRARVAYYNAVGSLLYGVKHGEQVPEPDMDALGAEEHMLPEGNGAPVELGLHWLSTDMNPALTPVVLPEPNERELWPDPIETMLPEVEVGFTAAVTRQFNLPNPPASEVEPMPF